MTILLKEKGIDGFLTKAVNEHVEVLEGANDSEDVRAEKLKKKETLMKGERKCHLVLIQRIHEDYLEYVKDKENLKEVWKALHESQTECF